MVTDRQFEIWQAQQIENSHYLLKILQTLRGITERLAEINQRFDHVDGQEAAS